MVSAIGKRGKFSFKDLAGIYTEGSLTRLFAECVEYEPIDGIRHLPKGKYLCLDCTRENCDEYIGKVLEEVRVKYNVIPSFYIQEVKVLGILSWNYQIQVYIGE